MDTNRFIANALLPVCHPGDCPVDQHGPPPPESDPVEFEQRLHELRKSPQAGGADVLKAATINGARALGEDQKLGSVEVGKLAPTARLTMPIGCCGSSHCVIWTTEPTIIP